MEEILKKIPHRPPFLFIVVGLKIISKFPKGDEEVTVRLKLSESEQLTDMIRDLRRKSMIYRLNRGNSLNQWLESRLTIIKIGKYIRLTNRSIGRRTRHSTIIKCIFC